MIGKNLSKRMAVVAAMVLLAESVCPFGRSPVSPLRREPTFMNAGYPVKGGQRLEPLVPREHRMQRLF